MFTPLFAAFNELNEESDEDEAPNAIVKLVGDSMPLLTYMRVSLEIIFHWGLKIGYSITAVNTSRGLHNPVS